MKLSQPIWPRFLSTRVVTSLATLGPIGRDLKAPGTWGSVAGLLYFLLFFFDASPLVFVMLSLAGCYFAVAICGEAEFRLGRKDPGQIILDEFVAMPLCFIAWRALLPVAPKWAIFLAGFTLFRFFDILKPLGISRLQRLPNGWGVVADDLGAALAACLSLHLIAWILRGG